MHHFRGSETGRLVLTSACRHGCETTVRRPENNVDAVRCENALNSAISGNVPQMLQMPLVLTRGSRLVLCLDEKVLSGMLWGKLFVRVLDVVADEILQRSHLTLYQAFEVGVEGGFQISRCIAVR